MLVSGFTDLIINLFQLFTKYIHVDVNISERKEKKMADMKEYIETMNRSRKRIKISLEKEEEEEKENNNDSNKKSPKFESNENWNLQYYQIDNVMIYPERSSEYYDSLERTKRTIRLGDITRKISHTHEFFANACDPQNESALILVMIPVLYFHQYHDTTISEEMYRLQGATLCDVFVCKPKNPIFNRKKYGEMLILYPKQIISDEQCKQTVVPFEELKWENPNTHKRTEATRHRCIGRLYGEKEFILRRPPSHSNTYKDGKIYKKLFYKKIIVPETDPKLPAEMYPILQDEFEEKQRKEKTVFSDWEPITKYKIQMIQSHIFDRRHTLASRERIFQLDMKKYDLYDDIP